jgi:Flp pilus assembly protein TadD
LDKKPDHPAANCARMDLARCLIADGQLQQAETVLRTLATKLPGSTRVQAALFSLQLRMGMLLDAAWTMRRAVKHIIPGDDQVANYFYCVVSNGGPDFLISEVHKLVKVTTRNSRQVDLLIKATELRLILDSKGYSPAILKQLESLADYSEASLEVMITAAESLLRAGKVASARRLLSKAIVIDPNYPRVLSLYAETYLRAGPFYNSEYGQQLAIEGCRLTAWKSPRELHVLAESYFHQNDLLSALATARLARQEGKRLFGYYRDSAELEELIKTLEGELVINQSSASELI